MHEVKEDVKHGWVVESTAKKYDERKIK